MSFDSLDKSSRRHLTHPAYRPDIDGLRAVAVLSVIGFHVFPETIPGGFIGVDIFFVISGYLISTIIFGNLERNAFSFSEFYARRVRRIFPALIIVMAASLILGWCILLPDEFKQLDGHLVASSAFIQNFVLWHESGYFDNEAASKPLLHLWSLAIEEQFYIFWPILLALLAKWKRKGSFLTLTAALAAVSFALNIYLASHDQTADYYSPFARFWELMTGGILAYATLHHSKYLAPAKNAQSVVGFILLALALFLIDKHKSFPGGWALLPVIGAFFIIAAGPRAWLNKTILSNRIFVGCGLISYPLYLWHWPLFTYARLVNPHLTLIAKLLLLGLTIALSVLTYSCLELKIRKWQSRTIPLYLTGVMALLLAVGILIMTIPAGPRLYSKEFSLHNEWDFIKTRTTDFDDNGNGFYPLHAERNPKTLFIGDSQLAQYAERVFTQQSENPTYNGAIFAIGAGCIPIVGVFADEPSRKGCWANRDAALRMASDKNIDTIVIGGSWNWYFSAPEYYYKAGDEHISLANRDGWKQAFHALEMMLTDLKKQNKEVYLLLGNPVNDDMDPHRSIARIKLLGLSKDKPPAAVKDYQRELRLDLLDIAKRTNVKVIDPYPTICKDDQCPILSESGIPVFKDSSHFNPNWAVNRAVFIDAAIEPSNKIEK